MSFAMERTCSNVLVVDSSYSFLKACVREFKKVGDAFPAWSIADAKLFFRVESKWVDIVLLDLGRPRSTLKFAKEIRETYPHITVCLMVRPKQIRRDFRKLHEGFFCIEKNADVSLIVSSVLNHWMVVRQQNKIVNQLPYKNELLFVSSKRRKNVEAIDFRLRRAGSPKVIRSVNYRHPNHPLRFSCGVCVGHGCKARCLFCLAAKYVRDDDVVLLNEYEIIAQVLHGLDSVLAYGCSVGKYEMSVEFTCGNDWTQNPGPVFRSIAMLDQVPELNHPLFVIPTIGNNKIFREYLPKMLDYKIRIYLSVHTLNRALRERLMPATAGESLEESRRILSWFANATGQKWTLCWMLMKGVNDSQEDIQSIVDFCKGFPVDVKVMLRDPSSCTVDKAKDFVEGINMLGNEFGVEARFAENLGKDSGETPSNITCGTTQSTRNIVEGSTLYEEALQDPAYFV